MKAAPEDVYCAVVYIHVVYIQMFDMVTGKALSPMIDSCV